MGHATSAGNTRLIETEIEGDALLGPFEFELNGSSPRNNLLDYFFFCDSSGSPIAATSGTVTVHLSPTAGIWHEIADGTFDASTALATNWVKPNGYGKAVRLRLTFDLLEGPIVGFKALITQAVA